MPNNTSTARGRRAPKGVFRRLVRTIFRFFPVMLPLTLVCIIINAVVSSMPSGIGHSTPISGSFHARPPSSFG